MKQTLPRIVSAGFDEVIVVDYDCPDKTAAWVREFFPSVQIVQVADEPVFNVSRARNLGAKASRCSWLCFIDADVEISPTYLQWLRRKATPDYFYRIEKTLNKDDAARYKGVYGTVACQRALFQKIGGFDEVFQGWGMEDDEFFVRLVLSGCNVAPVPSKHFIGAIRHDDDLRVAHYSEKRKKESSNAGQLYVSAKLHVMKLTNVLDIPIKLRQEIYNYVRGATAATANDSPVSMLVSDDMRIEIAQLGLSPGAAIPNQMVLAPRPHKPFAKLYKKYHFTTKLMKPFRKTTQVLLRKSMPRLP